MFPELNEIKFWSHSLRLQNPGIFADQYGLKEDPMKKNFGNFQTQKRTLQTVRAQKVEEKMGSFV